MFELADLFFDRLVKKDAARQQGNDFIGQCSIGKNIVAISWMRLCGAKGNITVNRQLEFHRDVFYAEAGDHASTSVLTIQGGLEPTSISDLHRGGQLFRQHFSIAVRSPHALGLWGLDTVFTQALEVANRAWVAECVWEREIIVPALKFKVASAVQA